MNHCCERGEEGGARGGEALARLPEPPKRQGKLTAGRSRSPTAPAPIPPVLGEAGAAVAAQPVVPSGAPWERGVHASRSRRVTVGGTCAVCGAGRWGAHPCNSEGVS